MTLESRKTQKDLKIVVVEDEAISAIAMETVLKQEGYDQVSISGNYHDAMEICARVNPDILILDINLNEEKTGIDIARENKSCKHVVFVSGFRKENYAAELENTDFDLYLEKPARTDLIIDYIHKISAEEEPL